MIDDLCAYLASVDDSESIIGREVPFWLAVPKDGFAVYVRGQIDALIGRNESIVVRDYKYSSHHGGHAEFYGLQMAAYGLATMESWPGRNVSGELIFLRGTRQRHEIEFPSPDAIRARIHDTSLAINRAIKENSFPKKPAGPDECRALGCGYVARCWYS